MPLPANIATIKIHPAIGFARISTNPDYYVAGDTVTNYKSNGVIKRQAVQFRLFAYDANGHGIEELTPQRLQALGLFANWHATVANLKIASKPSRDQRHIIKASASSGVNSGILEGQCHGFEEGQMIPLGQITGNGLFLPGIGSVYREDVTDPIPDHAGMRVDNVADNTCDGPISVTLGESATNQEVQVNVLDAWVVVAPPDFAPDWDDHPTVGPNNSENLLQALEHLLGFPNDPPATAVNAAARALDRGVLLRGTGDFAPGIEMEAPGAALFMTAAETGDPDEARIKRAITHNGAGVNPGELTNNLCSPWQNDFQVCGCSFWVNHRPDTAFRETLANPEVNWRRRDHTQAPPYADNDLIERTKDYYDHVFKLGIIRKQNNQRVEKERPNDV